MAHQERTSPNATTDPEKQSSSTDGERSNPEWSNDPENPLNWPKWKKVTIVGIVIAIGFSTPFAADVAAPSIPAMVRSLHSDSEMLRGFTVSIYVLGNAVGPILFAPASELWGRSVLFHGTYVIFLVFTAGCALATSMPMMLVFRFLAGCAGAAPLAVGADSIADMILRESRGQYFAVFATGGQLAPLIGPVVGGVLTQSLNWRWTFWIVVIIHGLITIVSFLFLSATHSHTILRRKSRHQDAEACYPGHALRQPGKTKFLEASIRPLKILVLSPMVLFLASYQALVWDYRFFMYTTIPIVFSSHYRFNATKIGLTYLGNGLGATVAMYAIAKVSDLLVVRHRDKHETDSNPSIRLLPLLWLDPLVPVGLFWYGWSAQTVTHWIVPILGTFFFAAGIVTASLPSNMYVVDAFTQHAASAMAGSILLRSIAGGLIPLAGNPMFDTMGVGWGCSLLGFVAAAACLFAVFFVCYEQKLRDNSLAKLVS